MEEFRGALDLAGKHSLPLFVLGGGSNILVSDSGFEGVVVHPACRGIEIRHEDAEAVTLEVNAAETWDDLVQHAVERNWWGIENLSHIPGQAGAALVQNIGAYGQQASDVVQSAQVMEISTGAPQRSQRRRLWFWLPAQHLQHHRARQTDHCGADAPPRQARAPPA